MSAEPRYAPFWGSPAAGVSLATCLDCGAVVGDQTAHTRFHATSLLVRTMPEDWLEPRLDDGMDAQRERSAERLRDAKMTPESFVELAEAANKAQGRLSKMTPEQLAQLAEINNKVQITHFVGDDCPGGHVDLADRVWMTSAELSEAINKARLPENTP